MAQVGLGSARSVCAAYAGGGLLEVEGSGAVPGFHRSEQLRGYLTSHMAEAQPVDWRFEPAATGDAPTPDRVKWHFKLDPYAGEKCVPLYTRTRTTRHSLSIARSRSRRASI